jgi:ABC-type sugar transport system ATPase subunit
MDDLVLRMQGITKRFYAVTALKEVNLDLRRGEVHALVGENGAGKSTLMKILSGSYPFHSFEGEVQIEGRPARFTSTRDAEQAGIEMIYQEISLNPELSVAENIFLGKLPRRAWSWFIDWKKTHALAREALAQVGLEVPTAQAVRLLSTSQQQMISIAKALYRRPRILVLDEPTSALTDRETETLMRILQGLRGEGISCIYISHKLEEVFNIADRITVLRDGSVISTTPRAEVVAARVVEDMVGRKIEMMYPKVRLPIGREVLRVENLSVPSRIPGRNIVQDLSFSLRAGEILGLGGLVGSGRSEVLNAIFGSYRRTGGRFFLDGQPVALSSPRDAIRCRLGLLTEDRRVSGFVGTMSIRENVSLASFRKIFGPLFLRRGAERREVQTLSGQLNIKTPSIETNVLTLSGGNQQKVVLAKWLMTEVRVLFLDEPTRGIDVGAKVEVYNLMTELARKGVAIVMISSELPELLAMCDRFLVLYGGAIRGRFGREEVSEHKFMSAATGVG